MFPRRALAGLLLAITAFAVTTGTAFAQTQLRGELGADVTVVDFKNQLTNGSDPYSVRRGISDQFLTLGLRGPLVDPTLGSYTIRTRLAGQYYRVGATSGDTSEYTTPRPTALATSIGLFPGRRYPVRVFYSWSQLSALNYEQENRAVDDVESPELAAVRRYDASSEAYGVDWRFGISPTADVVVEALHQNSTSERQYDFDEQRDIFVEFSTPVPDPTRPEVTIIVQNGVPEGEVDLLVDGVIITTLLPEERYQFLQLSGTHVVEFVPTNFNRFAATINVNGDMLWETFYDRPPGRTDVNRSEDAGRVEWTSGRDQRFQNRARMNYSDSFESVVGRSSLLLDVENDADFEWTPRTRLRSTTAWTMTQTSMQSSNDQDVKNFRQQTSLGYQAFQGGHAMGEHLYDRTATMTGPIDIVTTQNRLRGEAGKPWGPYQHRVTLRNVTTQIKNTDDYSTLENRAELRNDAAFFLKRFRLKPRNSLLYTVTNRKNPDSAFKEVELRPILEADRSGLPLLGDFMGVLELGWRRRAEDEKIDFTTRANWSLTLTRQFTRQYRLFASATSNNENYRTELTVDGVEPPPSRDPQRQRSVRVGVRAEPLSSVSMDLGYSYTSQVDQEQSEFRADLTVRVPWLNFPITSSYSNQKRMLAGRSDQSTTRWETKAAFNLRHIRIQFEHSYVAETLFTEDYALNMFRTEITRNFDIF